jgi:ATP-dependent DNA helicase RecQ
MMREYTETHGCRRQFLLSYFGEHLPGPCGNCDTCDAGLAQEEPPADAPYRLNERVRHEKFGEGAVLRFDGDKVVIRFDEVGYRTLSLATLDRKGLLTRPARSG